jgi:hypothetical protein
VRGLEIRLKTSKTYPFRRGVTLGIGATGPLFVLFNGFPISGHFVAMQGVIAGIAGKYAIASRHVLIRAAFGLPDHLIKTLGRWSSNADQRYIRTPSHVLTSVLAPLVYLCTVLEEGSSASNACLQRR